MYDDDGYEPHPPSQLFVAFSVFSRDFLAGAVAAAASKTMMAPLERTKLILQVGPAGGSPFYGVGGALARTVAQQGLLALWKGNAANVMRLWPIEAVNFACKEQYKWMLLPGGAAEYLSGVASFWRFLGSNLVAGGAAGVTSLLFAYPLQMARTRLALELNQGLAKKLSPPFVFTRFLSMVIQRDGFFSLYKGFLASFDVVMIYRAVLFGGFDTAKVLLLPDKEVSIWKTWLLAQTVSMVASIIAHPFDLVRKRLSWQASRTKPLYSGTLDCWRQIASQEGPAAFFRGVLPTSGVRSIGAGIMLMLYEQVQQLLAKAAQS